MFLRRTDHPSRGVLLGVVYLSVIVKLRQRGGREPQGLLRHGEGEIIDLGVKDTVTEIYCILSIGILLLLLLPFYYICFLYTKYQLWLITNLLLRRGNKWYVCRAKYGKENFKYSHPRCLH